MAVKKKVAKKKTTVRKLRTELKSAIGGKKPTVKKRMLVKEKKELLDELIVCEEEAEKINKAMRRVNERRQKLVAKNDKICKKLAEGLFLNKENIDTPILYKGRSFKLEEKLDWYPAGEFNVTIEKVKKL